MKNFFGYLFCIGIAVLMAVMIDGKGGILISCILIIALALSVFLKYYLSRKISVSMDCKHKLLSKGDIVEVKIRVDKHTRFPSPLLEFELESSPQLIPVEEKAIRFAIAPNHDHKTITVRFKAFYSGLSYIKLKRFDLFDFLGLFNHTVKTENEILPLELKIMPNVPDTGTQIEVIRVASDNTSFDDSDEETSDTAIGSTGTPGYEHRVYNPGDPLKKINWKMSSKRGIYMVRLDEKLSVTSQVFVLDMPVPENDEVFNCRKADNIIEGALAMLSMLVQQGLETDFHYYLGKWCVMSVKTLGDVYLLAEELAGLVPYDCLDRFPDEVLRSSTNICFTTISISDAKLTAELFSYRNITVITDLNSGFNAQMGDIWTCSEDFEFKHLN